MEGGGRKKEKTIIKEFCSSDKIIPIIQHLSTRGPYVVHMFSTFYHEITFDIKNYNTISLLWPLNDNYENSFRSNVKKFKFVQVQDSRRVH